MITLSPSFSFTFGKGTNRGKEGSHADIAQRTCEWNPEALLVLIAILLLSSAVLVFVARH